MTESQWFASADPDTMLDFLRARHGKWNRCLTWLGLSGQATHGRKERLFVCACCRRIWDLLEDRHSRQAVETGELYADGLARRRHLKAARTAAREATARVESQAERGKTWAAGAALLAATDGLPVLWSVAWAAAAARKHSGGATTERQAQCDLLREIFGNPFRAVAIDPTWLKWDRGQVAEMARVIYTRQRFEEMPLLGEALGKAGCDDETILAHCQFAMTHVRGCWVVDALLGKSR